MIYLAIQTFAWLGLTAVVFFGLGYVFHRRFARSLVVVSDQPPLDPPPPQRPVEEFDKVIKDLRTRLLEKERDLAELLESVPQSSEPQPHPEDAAKTERLEMELAEIHASYDKQVARNREIEQRCLELAEALKAQEERIILPVEPQNDHKEEIERLTADVAMKTAQAQAMQIEIDRMRTTTVDKEDFDRLRAELAQKEAELVSKGHLLVQREADLELMRQDQESREEVGSSTVIASLADAELNELREELARKVSEIADYQKRVDSLESQVYEREYLLQMARNQQEKEREDLARAVDAIWEEDDLSLEEPAPMMPVAPEPPALEVNRRFDELNAKIQGLEATIENLRSENEMALLTAVELNRALDSNEPSLPPAPKASSVNWDPPPEFIEMRDREQAVEALWKAEKDAEKEKLRRSVENLKSTLDAKEKAIEDLGQQLEDLSGKVDPKLLGPDDLQLIKGIGPFIRKLLEKEFGIRSFEQLAKISPSEAERISERLFFKNQIERDGWLDQARELHLKKYNRPIE